MSKEIGNSIERFQVSGNVLKIMPRFDPRYQSRAGLELMNIVSSLATDGEGSEVILDISDAGAFPSMMIGMLCEARDLADKAGKRLKIRLKAATYDRMQSLGLAGVFTTAPSKNGVADDLELIPDAEPPRPDDEGKAYGS